MKTIEQMIKESSLPVSPEVRELMGFFLEETKVNPRLISAIEKIYDLGIFKTERELQTMINHFLDGGDWLK
jgi:hypothetical protein